MTAHVVLNDASFAPARGWPNDESDESLLGGMLRALSDLRKAVAPRDHGRLRLCLPPGSWAELRLPGGSPLRGAMSRLEKNERELVTLMRNMLTRNVEFNDRGGIVEDSSMLTEAEARMGAASAGAPPAALLAASALDGLCWSAAHPLWQSDEIAVHGDLLDPTEGSMAVGEARRVPNLWRHVTVVHRKAIAKHLEALPIYENPGHHDPDGPTREQQAEYIKWRRVKSEIPRNVEVLLREAVPDETRNGAVWWAHCECGHYHRFAARYHDNWPVVHWNGTTDKQAYGNRNPKSKDIMTEEDVPRKVRERLSKLPRVADCGCR